MNLHKDVNLIMINCNNYLDLNTYKTYKDNEKIHQSNGL